MRARTTAVWQEEDPAVGMMTSHQIIELDEDFNDGGAGANGCFQCRVCRVSCNSRSVYQQHLQGAKHQKRAGGSFAQLVLQCEEPMVGLRYVTQLLPETCSSNFVPWYSCSLCSVSGSAASMVSHLTGSKHFARFVQDTRNVSSSDRIWLKQVAQQEDAEQGRDLSLVKQVFSDHLYPFPAKVPAPVKTSLHEADLKHHTGPADKPHTEPPSGDGSALKQLLTTLTECAVKNAADAELAFSVSDKLISSLIRFRLHQAHNKQEESSIRFKGDQLKRLLADLYLNWEPQPSMQPEPPAKKAKSCS